MPDVEKFKELLDESFADLRAVAAELEEKAATVGGSI
jgi:hypothetical protein